MREVRPLQKCIPEVCTFEIDVAEIGVRESRSRQAGVTKVKRSI
jgi:hypothetical protein